MNISASALAITFAITATAFPAVTTIDGIVGPSVIFEVTGRIARKVNIYPQGLEIAFGATCSYVAPNNLASIGTAARDIMSQWRMGCMDNPQERVKQQVLYCLNAGLQQFYASSRIVEFVVNMRVQEYPPEFFGIVDAGAVIQFTAAPAVDDGVVPALSDVVRYAGHKWQCILSHSYDPNAIPYANPSVASDKWVMITEADYDLFTKGVFLPTVGRTMAGLPIDSRLQHVGRVVWTLQSATKPITRILSPLHTTEFGGLKQLDANTHMGVLADWDEDLDPTTATPVTVDCTNSPPGGTSPVLFPTASVTVTKGMWVNDADDLIPQNAQVVSQNKAAVSGPAPYGSITIDASPTGTLSALTPDTVVFTPNVPPQTFEVFRDHQGRPSIRCFPGSDADINTSVFVQWCPAARPITWGDVEAGTPFDIALPYLELYLFPLIRHAALQSKYFPAEDVPVYGPGIKERYAEVLKLLEIADIQVPHVVQPHE